jgi:hypothetical protein
MAADTADLTGNNIVLVGTFDPTLAQPATLLKEEIIRISDMPDMVIELLFPDAVSFRLPWMSALIETNRVMVTNTLTNPAPEPIRDFAVDLIDLMKSARIKAMGINTNHHFGTTGPDAINRLGHILAPKEKIWDTVLDRPLLLTMTIRGQRTGDIEGNINVRVEPSTRIEYGVYIEVNNHFEVTDQEMEKEPKGLANRLLDQWVPSIQKAEEIITMIRQL